MAIPIRSMPQSIPAPPDHEALAAAVREACGARRQVQAPDGTTLGEAWLVGAWRSSEGAPPALGELAGLDGGGFHSEASIWCAGARRWIGLLTDAAPDLPRDSAPNVTVFVRPDVASVI